MAETSTFTTGERRRRALGAASLVLSAFSGALLLLILFVWRFLERVAGPPTAGPDAPGLGLVVALVALACVLSILAALGLAAVALLRPGWGWPMAAAGWMVGAGALCLAGAQVGARTAGPEVHSEDGMAMEEAEGTGWEEPTPDMGAGGVHQPVPPTPCLPAPAATR